MIRSFWKQPHKRYRNFQIAFTVLTLNFAIPTLFYIFSPETAASQFIEANAAMGGSLYAVDEAASRFWRILGAANVATLAFMCFLLQFNLRRYRPVLVPLTFMKATAATLWLAGYIATPEYPVFLAAAILDYATSGAFVVFCRRAWNQIAEVEDAGLVPRPGWAR